MRLSLRHIQDMPIEFIRGVLGLLCAFFAYMAGQSAAAGRRKSRTAGWVLRTLLCAAGLIVRHRIDIVVGVVYVLAVVAFVAAWWVERHPRREENLTREIFPTERDPE